MSNLNEGKTPSAQDVERGFALVKAARAMLNDLPERRVSDVTARKYARLYGNMQVAGKRPEEIARTRRSYYVYRAATNFILPEVIRDALRAADRAAKAKDRSGWWTEVLRLRDAIAALRRYRPDPFGEQLKSGEKSAVSIPRGASRSKRRDLKRLPDDWRQRLWAVVPVNSKYRAAVAAAILTGIRPAELVKGVDVRAKPNGELVFDIRGAKTQGGRYGQAARRLTLAAPGAIGDYLRELIGAASSLKVSVGDGRLFGNQVREFGRKCWPRKELRISPYSMRHQLAADLKAAGDPDAVSLALGHAVADTAQRYGTARQARQGGGRLLAVETTRALKKERKLEKTAAISRFRDRARDRDR